MNLSLFISLHKGQEARHIFTGSKQKEETALSLTVSIHKPLILMKMTELLFSLRKQPWFQTTEEPPGPPMVAPGKIPSTVYNHRLKKAADKQQLLISFNSKISYL